MLRKHAIEAPANSAAAVRFWDAKAHADLIALAADCTTRKTGKEHAQHES